MRADRPEGPRASQRRIGLIAEEITREIIGAFFEVRKDLKPSYLESVYRNAMEIAVRDRGLRVEREVGLDVRFRGQVVGTFRADLLVEETVIVEAKMVDRLHAAHIAQVTNYLRTTNLQVGLLLNFGAYSEYRRIVWTSPR
jgi:GxxExxY protein